jgi:two-component system CheB/CheR fusion protein
MMPDTDSKLLESVRIHLLKARGLDVRGYSQAFIMRSVRKRLGRTGCETLAAYVDLLRSSEEETNEFLNVLSINVTEFFRDEGVFEAVSREILRPLLRSKAGSGGIVRIWSAGCATGQEAYTIALCLDQELRRLDDASNILASVTGSDLSSNALAFARKGIYTADHVKRVPAHLLAQYFSKVDGQYAVNEELKRRVRFMKENLLDEPHQKFFDLIVCRNVLIYFSRPSHDQVVMNLHKALRPDGYLVLGRTESMVGSPRLHFELIDAENRIFRKAA